MNNGLNILIVDKNAKSQTLLKDTLESAGYIVTAAPDGDNALDILENERPDLILSEISLPKVDGWELCWIIRERPDLSDIPFVFLTTKTKVSDEVLSFELGADDYIKKPYIKNELLARIKGLLARLKRTRSVSEPSPGGVKGDLKDMSISDILQILNIGKRSAAVHIASGEKRGSIFVLNGRVVHAKYGELKGEEALFNIMGWAGGSFLIEAGASVNVRSINLSTEMILLEGYKRIDEGNNRGEAPNPESMEEGEALTLKALFDIGIIEEKGH